MKVSYLKLSLIGLTLNIVPLALAGKTLAAVTFEGGFETALYQYPNAINNWHDPQPYPPGERLTRVNNPVRKDNWSFRAEVRPGDNYGSSGERAEIYGMYGPDGKEVVENEQSGTQFYTLSIYLPPDWSPPVTNDPWEPFGIFMQLHGPDILHASPSFAINARDTYYISIHSGDQDQGPDYFVRDYQLGSVLLGQWVDFVFKIKWAKTPTGTLDVWRRNQNQTDFTELVSVINIPTLQFKSSINNGDIENHYWKTGYYRSREPHTNVVFLDSHTRGDSFDEVVVAAFPTTVSPSSTPETKPGDANGDNQVDGIDYVIWLNNYNN